MVNSYRERAKVSSNDEKLWNRELNESGAHFESWRLKYWGSEVRIAKTDKGLATEAK